MNATSKGTPMEKAKLHKPLPIYGGEILPAGAQITLTDEWETIPVNVKGRLILDPSGTKRLVSNEDLEYALGAH